MKKLLITWACVLVLWGATFSATAFVGKIWLNAKYPYATFFEKSGGQIDTVNLESYRSERRTIIQTFLIASAIIAAGSVIGVSQKK